MPQSVSITWRLKAKATTLSSPRHTFELRVDLHWHLGDRPSRVSELDLLGQPHQKPYLAIQGPSPFKATSIQQDAIHQKKVGLLSVSTPTSCSLKP